jgi:hypothetical protein
MHRQQRVEEVRQADAARFGDQPIARAVAVEAPRATGGDLQARFVVAAENFIGDATVRCAVR